ncbi:hypothetical protein D3C72_1150430 [compost metagenome]
MELPEASIDNRLSRKLSVDPNAELATGRPSRREVCDQEPVFSKTKTVPAPVVRVVPVIS